MKRKSSSRAHKAPMSGKGREEAIRAGEVFRAALGKVGLKLGPDEAPHKWYETPFVGVRNAATEIKNNPTIRTVLDHVPGGNYVKAAADKIGRGACKCPDGKGSCMKSAPGLAKRGMEGGSIVEAVSNAVAKIPLPTELSANIKSILNTHGEGLVTGVQVCRVPIVGAIQKVINFLRTATGQKPNAAFDTLYHLYVIVRTAQGSWRLEMNQTYSMFAGQGEEGKGSACKGVSTPSNTKLTAFVSAPLKYAGFLRYSALDNNCQDHAIQILQANGVLTGDLRSFIKQDTKNLLPSFFGNLANTVTDWAAKLTNLVGYGCSKPGCTITRRHRHVRKQRGGTLYWQQPKPKRTWLDGPEPRASTKIPAQHGGARGPLIPPPFITQPHSDTHLYGSLPRVFA